MVGAVYDRGYRGYEGDRGGRAAARTALFLASVRRALGIRRPWRQKVAPAVLLAIATVPAIVFVGVGYVTRDTPASDFEWITYREYVGVSTYLLAFVALTAPDIMCPDRRQRVLPLVFARPLTGADYVLAKVGAMFALVFAFGFLPQVVLFLGQMLVSEDGALRYARDNAEVLWQVPVAVAVLAIYYAVDQHRDLVAHVPPHHRRRHDHRPAAHLGHRERDPRRAVRRRRPRSAGRPALDGRSRRTAR